MAEQQHSSSQKLPRWMQLALAPQRVQRIRVKRPAKRAVKWVGSNGKEHKLNKSESRQQFMWKATGCIGVLQHYRLCTPDALRKEVSLLCCFCGIKSGAWRAAGRAAPPPAEAKFMLLLMDQQQSDEWCWQYHLQGREGRLDFYSWKRDVYVQIDDEYHFSNGCKNDAFIADKECNAHFYNVRLALVRVHHADLDRPAIVMAAIESALQHKCVVFTASYDRSGMPHVDAFCHEVQAAAQPSRDTSGNLIVKH